jgi:hypothetical protein
MPIKHVGYKWQQWLASQAGKVRERVHPSQRKKPGPQARANWAELSDEQRAYAIEEERLRYMARSAEFNASAAQEREHQRQLRQEASMLRAKRRALAEEEQRLMREEAHLASKLRRQEEDDQWDYEKNMEDYVMGRKPIV